MSPTIPNHGVTPAFREFTNLIEQARQQSYQAVNTILIDLYWQIGEMISRKVKSAEWGEGVVEQLAKHITETQPGLRGFTRPNLFRMRSFLRDLPRGCKSLTTGETIALVT